MPAASCGAAASARPPVSEPGPCLSPSGRLAAAACLGTVGSLGFCSNLLVLVLFWRHRALRSPINLLLLNIAVSDLLVCALGTPLGLAAAARGRGSPGAACAWHGFANALCGERDPSGSGCGTGGGGNGGTAGVCVQREAAAPRGGDGERGRGAPGPAARACGAGGTGRVWARAAVPGDAEGAGRGLNFPNFCFSGRSSQPTRQR